MRTSTRKLTLGPLSLALLATPVAITGTAASAPADPGSSVDSTVRVDPNGKPYVVDPGVGLQRRQSASTPTVAPFPLDQTFLLHSKPDSQHTIFLDFDGTTVTGTGWNQSGVSSGFHQGWTLDGDGTTFNDIERTAIQSIWQRVAEDYAPFDVDVTTLEPAAAALDRSTSSDLVFGTRALISQSNQAWTALCGQGCGGVAYLDVFDDFSSHSAYQPVWVFADGLANDTKWIAEAATHEVGHNFGLDHDGNATQGYDTGHGIWAPIMGAAYYRPISQWSKGGYSGADNQQDDLAIIASNGAPLRADESTTLPAGAAYITTRTDTDTYVLGSCSGAISVTANPAPASPNLDIELSLLDASNATVTSSDPLSALVSYDEASGMGASIATTVPAGRYRVQVDGVGNGTPVTGYDDYASVGAYTLAVTGTCAPVATAPSAPTSLAVVANAAARTVTLSWGAPTSDGGSAVTGYEVREDGTVVASPAAGTTSQVVGGLTRGSTYSFSVRARNAVGTGPDVTTSLTVPALAPGAPAIGRASSGAKGGKSTAIARWRPPADDGGAPVLQYRVVAHRLNAGGAVAGSVTSGWLAPTTRSLKMRLKTGRWRFAVLARNSVGPGPLSAKSNAVRAR